MIFSRCPTNVSLILKLDLGKAFPHSALGSQSCYFGTICWCCLLKCCLSLSTFDTSLEHIWQIDFWPSLLCAYFTWSNKLCIFLIYFAQCWHTHSSFSWMLSMCLFIVLTFIPQCGHSVHIMRKIPYSYYIAKMIRCGFFPRNRYEYSWS